jgi:hypothetical protein
MCHILAGVSCKIATLSSVCSLLHADRSHADRSHAAAERVFSILKNSFSVCQMRQSLEDYTECSVTLQHNKNNVEMINDL